MFIAPLQDEVSGLSLGGGGSEEKAAESGIMGVKRLSEQRSYLPDS